MHSRNLSAYSLRTDYTLDPRRLQARGFSGYSVLLRMSRQEIGSYLGVKLETVSRTFSKFQAAGLLFVSQRQILIADAPGLRQVLERGVVS